MAQNLGFPNVGHTVVYKAANGGENINSHSDLAAMVTNVNSNGTYNVVVVPDTGGALVAKNGVSFHPGDDHTTCKAGYIHWPQPRF